MRFLCHFERSEAESRDLFFDRFLHFGPFYDPQVEMTKAHIIIIIRIIHLVLTAMEASFKIRIYLRKFEGTDE